MKQKHVLGRARQLNMVWQVESLKPSKRDRGPKRPAQLPGLSPSPNTSPSPPPQRRATRPSQVVKLHSPIPGPAQAPVSQSAANCLRVCGWVGVGTHTYMGACASLALMALVAVSLWG